MTESKLKSIEYAKNYPLIPNDSPFIGPFTVGNVGIFNERKIINLCCKTVRSTPLNASLSFPLKWTKASAFKPGDVVNVKVADGYVQNLWHARPETISSRVISQPISKPDDTEESNAVTVVTPADNQQRPF